MEPLQRLSLYEPVIEMETPGSRMAFEAIRVCFARDLDREQSLSAGNA
jgi:hypothetical protein